MLGGNVVVLILGVEHHFMSPVGLLLLLAATGLTWEWLRDHLSRQLLRFNRRTFYRVSWVSMRTQGIRGRYSLVCPCGR